MFRFNRSDNAAAGELFARAIAGAPNFTRAHAGLSFVRFQDAFLGYVPDVRAAARDARRSAERGLELDPLDPFANLVMGRSHLLDGDLETSAGWLERATQLSPSYAHAIYARAWTHALSGHGAEGKGDADLAMALSPLDPMHYAMAATRAFGHMVCGEDVEAAFWSEAAARSPGAHVLIAVIAVAAHELGGDHARAAAWATQARERNPVIAQADFFRAFPFADVRVRERIARALALLRARRRDRLLRRPPSGPGALRLVPVDVIRTVGAHGLPLGTYGAARGCRCAEGTRGDPSRATSAAGKSRAKCACLVRLASLEV